MAAPSRVLDRTQLGKQRVKPLLGEPAASASLCTIPIDRLPVAPATHSWPGRYLATSALADIAPGARKESMASSDPPFDAADNPTTQPLRRSEPELSEAAQEPQPPATSALRQSTNWFEPDFDADVPTTAVTQPVEPALENPDSPESKVEAAPAEIPPPSADSAGSATRRFDACRAATDRCDR